MSDTEESRAPFLCIDPRVARCEDASLHLGRLPVSPPPPLRGQPPTTTELASDLVAVDVVAAVRPGAWMRSAASGARTPPPASDAADTGAEPRPAHFPQTEPRNAIQRGAFHCDPTGFVHVDAVMKHSPELHARTSTSSLQRGTVELATTSANESNTPIITNMARKVGQARKEADGLPVWERAIRYGDEKRIRCEVRRLEQEAQALDGCVFKPTINVGKKASAGPTLLGGSVREHCDGSIGGGPVRIEPAETADQRDVGTRLYDTAAASAARRELLRAEAATRATEDLSFSPRIAPKSRRLARDASGGRRGVNALVEWEMDSRIRRERLARQREAEMLAECTYRPRIDPVSDTLAKLSPMPAAVAQASSNSTVDSTLLLASTPSTPVHERLLEHGRIAALAAEKRRKAEERRAHSLTRKPSDHSGSAVFLRLHEEAKERQYDAMLRDAVAAAVPAGVSVDGESQLFAPVISAGTRALVGDGLPTHRSAVHDRLLEEGRAQRERAEQRRIQALEAAARDRDVARYLTPTTVLLSALHKAGRGSSPHESRSPACRNRRTDSPGKAAAPRITDTSRVMDAAKLREAYGANVPDRVTILYDREARRCADLERAKEEQQRLRDAELRSAVVQVPKETRAVASTGENKENDAKKSSIYERQIAWRSAKLQQLERKKEELQKSQLKADAAECTFAPRINSTQASGAPEGSTGATSLKEQLRIASPATRMRHLVAATEK